MGEKVDRRTDIFSLGIVLFEMLTAERLFCGDSDLTILEQVRDARSEAPSLKNPDVPKKVDQIVLKALAKNPQDRYQNASEMEKDINSVLYSFSPRPGPADLAIYMHRLVEATAAASDAQIDAAVAQVAAAPAPEEKKKGKGLVISKKERAAEPDAGPEAGRSVAARDQRRRGAFQEPYRPLRRYRGRGRRPRCGGLFPDSRQGAGDGRPRSRSRRRPGHHRGRAGDDRPRRRFRRRSSIRRPSRPSSGR